MSYHYIPIGMAKKTNQNKCWQRHGATGTLLYTVEVIKNGTTIWKRFWEFLRKFNVHLNDTAIPLITLYSGDVKA